MNFKFIITRYIILNKCAGLDLFVLYLVIKHCTCVLTYTCTVCTCIKGTNVFREITRQQNVEFTAHVSRVALSYAIFSREKTWLTGYPNV